MALLQQILGGLAGVFLCCLSPQDLYGYGRGQHSEFSKQVSGGSCVLGRRSLCVFSATASAKWRWDTRLRNQPCPKTVSVVRNPAGALKLLLTAGVTEVGKR